MIYSRFSFPLLFYVPVMSSFWLIVYRPLWYHAIHIFSFVIGIWLLFIDISYIKYCILVMISHHIPNLMSIHVHVVIVYFCSCWHVLWWCFSLKYNCLFVNISNINFIKFNYFHIPYFLKILFYFYFPLSYLFIYIHIVYFWYYYNKCIM